MDALPEGCEGMTYSVYDVTDHCQLSIRGTTGSHPDSMFVFGIFMDEECLGAPAPDCAYTDMDWSEAVRMAKWILKEDEWIQNALKRANEEN